MKSVLNIHWKDWCWSWNSNTLAIWYKELTHLKRPWCWERLKTGGEGDNRVWDGWMASLTLWTWAWPSSGRWWWTGKPGVLQSMGSQRVGHSWATKLYWMCMLISLHSLNKCLSAYDLLMLCVVFFKIFQYNLPFKITSCRLWRELFLQAIHRRIKIRAQRCRLMFHLLASLHISSCWDFRLLPQRRWMNILV